MGEMLTGRRLGRLALAAAGAIFAVVLPARAAMGPAHQAPSYRLALTREADVPGQVFTARLDRSSDGGRSWTGASAQTLTFAFVGEGAVTSISNSKGGLFCTTSASGTCTVTVDSPGDSLLSASYDDLTANAAV